MDLGVTIIVFFVCLWLIYCSNTSVCLDQQLLTPEKQTENNGIKVALSGKTLVD